MEKPHNIYWTDAICGSGTPWGGVLESLCPVYHVGCPSFPGSELQGNEGAECFSVPIPP